MKVFLIAALSIIFSVAAQFLLKAGMSSTEVKAVIGQAAAFRTISTVLTNKFVLIGFILYGLGAAMWLIVLSKWDVSKAYPLIGLGFGLAVLIGFSIGENITGLRVLGVLLICQGVWLVASS